MLDGGARRLIAEHVDSVGALDLLVLARGQPGRWWTAGDICDALQCPPRWATLHLERLRTADVLEAKGDRVRRYRFTPRDAGVAEAVDAVADAYAARPREVVKLIFSLRA